MIGMSSTTTATMICALASRSLLGGNCVKPHQFAGRLASKKMRFPSLDQGGRESISNGGKVSWNASLPSLRARHGVLSCTVTYATDSPSRVNSRRSAESPARTGRKVFRFFS